MRASLFAIGAAVGLLAAPATRPEAPRPRPLPVRAVLFFSPTCPHCHQVISQDLPVIFERFGGQPRVWVDRDSSGASPAFYYLTNGQLEVLLVDASQPAGGALYDVASERLAIPPDRMGVPRLVVGDSVLVGSLEIPTQFPGMIQRAEAAGGLDWPAIPGLVEHVPTIPPFVGARVADTAAAGTAADTAAGEAGEAGAAAARPPQRPQQETRANPETPVPAQNIDTGRTADTVTTAHTDARDTIEAPTAVSTATPAESGAVQSSLESIPGGRESAWQRFRRDPTGNTVAVMVLLFMLASLFVVSSRAATWDARDRAAAAVPVLAFLGAAVAAYLAYVEVSNVTAVCGPVGDCNAVQQSPYAEIVGIPIGVLGVAGYAVILLAWFVGRFGGPSASRRATLALFATAFVGVVFSFYLTLLEPFVIGATCMWCLSSAVIMTLIFWLAAGPGTRAWHRRRGG